MPTQDQLTVVICLDHASVTGGQAKVAFDSAIGLKAAGHRPIVFAAAGPVDPLLRDNDIEVVCLGQTDLLGASSKLKGAAQGVWNFEAERTLRKLLDAMPANRTIVHVHGWAKALSPSIASAIKASRLPAIFTLHDYFLFCPTGGFTIIRRTNSVCESRSARRAWSPIAMRSASRERSGAARGWRSPITSPACAASSPTSSAFRIFSATSSRPICRRAGAFTPSRTLSRPTISARRRTRRPAK